MVEITNLHPIDFDRNLFYFLVCFIFSFSMKFDIIIVQSRLCFLHWFSLWLFFIINNFKLVAKNSYYAVLISSPTHACIRAPPTLVCTCMAVIIIWQAQNGDPTVLPETPDK